MFGCSVVVNIGKSNYPQSMTLKLSVENCAVALLIVNKVEKLPFIAINSIREVCNAPIFVGYTNYSDVASLSEFSNLYLIDLSSHLADFNLPHSSEYLDYNNPDFYQLVQLKWHLFEKLLKDQMNDCAFLVYSDFDVCWIENPIHFLAEIFERNSEVQVCVQDASAKLAQKSLCMGLVAFRNSRESLAIINDAKKLHRHALESNPKTGDDWVISELYSRSGSKSRFWLLPQMSFPVGLMANTFLDRGIFSGLVPPNPYVFHANYLVGSQRKALMMANMLRVFNKVNSIPVGDNLRIKIRKYLVPIKRVIVAFKFAKLFK